MFKKEEPRRKRGSFLPFVIFRTLLSLAMLCILSLGVYQAFRYFSGVDPIKLDPKAIVLSAINYKEIIKGIEEGNFNYFKNLSNLNNSGEKILDSKPLEVPEQPSGPSILKFAIMADSHIDNTNLEKALKQSKEQGAEFIVGLGDYSDVGTTDELGKAKQTFDLSGMTSYLTAGDHDLWDSRNQGQAASSNFSKVFGSPYQIFSVKGIYFVIVYNSDNYLGVESLQKQWLEDSLQKAKNDPELKKIFVFLHEPLYHPSSDHFMGSTRVEGGKDRGEIAQQAKDLVDLFKSVGVAEVFAGDAHVFGRYTDARSGLKMTTVGALTTDRNTQAPRYSMVDVFENGSYNVEDLEI